jgi:hypothetical protein
MKKEYQILFAFYYPFHNLLGYNNLEIIVNDTFFRYKNSLVGIDNLWKMQLNSFRQQFCKNFLYAT